jgi:multidrug efflux system membrane fusion protein
LAALASAALCLASMASLTALSACGRADGKDAKRQAVPVYAADARNMTVPLVVQAVGNVEAYASVAVKPQVTGAIAKQLVRDGQDVTEGQALFVIDQRSYQTAVHQAQAQLQKDQAQAAKAEDDLKRFQALFDQGAVSREQLDQMQTNARTLRASLSLDRAQIEQARLQLDYATIRAPISGRAGHVLVQVGNVVGKSNDDRTLLVINQVEPVFVTFAVPEAHLPTIQKMNAQGPLEVEAKSGEAEILGVGRLTSIDNSVDKATGTIRLKAEFPNRERSLWPGQFVRVHLKLGERRDAVVIPAQAVQNGVNGTYVFVVKSDSSVDMRTVTTTPAPDQDVIVDSGLRPGEKVVVDGQIMLVPGSVVEIKQAPQATPTPATPTPAAPPEKKDAAQANATAPPQNGDKAGARASASGTRP